MRYRLELKLKPAEGALLRKLMESGYAFAEIGAALRSAEGALIWRRWSEAAAASVS